MPDVDVRRSNIVRIIGLVCLAAAAILMLLAVALAAHIEPTTEAIKDAEKGQVVGVSAALGAVSAIVAMIGSFRLWGLIVVTAAVLLCGTSAVLYGIL